MKKIIILLLAIISFTSYSQDCGRYNNQGDRIQCYVQKINYYSNNKDTLRIKDYRIYADVWEETIYENAISYDVRFYRIQLFNLEGKMSDLKIQTGIMDINRINSATISVELEDSRYVHGGYNSNSEKCSDARIFDYTNIFLRNLEKITSGFNINAEINKRSFNIDATRKSNSIDTRYDYHVKNWEQKKSSTTGEFLNGDSEAEFQKNMTLATQFLKMGNNTDAYEYWKIAYDNYPSASESIYILGDRIYKKLIKQESDLTKKNTLIDELTEVYDKRIEYFGQEGYVLGLMGGSLYKVSKAKLAPDVYELTKRAIEIDGEKTKAQVLNYFTKASIDLYKSGILEREIVKESYALAINTLDKAYSYNKLQKQKYDNDNNEKEAKKCYREINSISKMKLVIDDLFKKSGLGK